MPMVRDKSAIITGFRGLIASLGAGPGIDFTINISGGCVGRPPKLVHQTLSRGKRANVICRFLSFSAVFTVAPAERI